ncbi:MAG: hypothetical protein GX422_14430 [Deltaproteobacteria bacterium]|jgi:phage FluMu protein Com|nr:hypothetical protein [Deltaproteobacteria bacterium]
MNPLFASVISAVAYTKRTCPKCRKTQMVSPRDKKKTVICKSCGSEIPPPPDQKRF